MTYQKNDDFIIRQAHSTDLKLLVELEKVWPESARASEELLKFRLNLFPQGYFVAENDTGIIASLICYPYLYQSNNLSHYSTWDNVEKECYELAHNETNNALYILSGTSKPSTHQSKIFDGGIQHAVDLARQLGKHYVVGGSLIPGYANYIDKKGMISACDYVFKQINGRYVDPLIEKYRKLGFYVPNEHHILANYFIHKPSLNYSALVVKDLLR